MPHEIYPPWLSSERSTLLKEEIHLERQVDFVQARIVMDFAFAIIVLKLKVIGFPFMDNMVVVAETFSFL